MCFNSSLEFQIDMINTYCMLVFFHMLRVNSDVNEIWDTIYNHIRVAVGARCTRVALDRLLNSRKFGGYGLTDINIMDAYMKRTWINYVIKDKDAKFSRFVSGWNEETKKDAKTVVGPIMSWNNMNGESKFLCYISRRWKNKRFFLNFTGLVKKWNFSD